ncbi:MAG: vanadium-dependent haloperoxidase [Intrasporangiaceae bacterium]|nr:vanadium-dependent haloperoxidase [Intrasporangiaceae bacterium]
MPNQSEDAVVSVTRRGFMGGVLAAGAWSSAAAPAFSAPKPGPSPVAGASGDVAIEWNMIAQNFLQPAMATPMPGSTTMGTMPAMSGMSMPRAFVILSYAHAAMYNAVVAIEGGYQPWMVATTAPAGASAPAAAAAAVHAVLVKHLPEQKDMLDMKLWDTLKVLGSASGDRAKGTAVGRAAAEAVLALRAGDVLFTPGPYDYPDRAPGVWEPWPPSPDPTVIPPPLDPWVATMKPFVMTTPSQFRPGPPPTLKSRTYVQDLEEVRLMGAVNSTARTAEQTEIARFWQTNGVIQYNEMFRDVAQQRGLGLLEAARFFAMGNLIGTDAMVAAFDAKYHYGFWRPWSAIRRADEDGSPSTAPDRTWMHLVMLPNHPEYVAAHTTFASAIAELLTAVLGTSRIGISLTSTTTMVAPTKTYTYATAEDLRSQVINARTWGGLHYRNSSVIGNDVGRRVAVHALKIHFRPASRR